MSILVRGLFMSSRVLRALVGVVAAVVAWPAAAGAQVTTSTYPDLRAMPPTSLSIEKENINLQDQYFLYFVPRTYNGGPGPFEVQRVPQSSGLANLEQRIYESPAGFHDEQVAQTPFDLTFTFDLPNISRYELWTQQGFNRALSRGFTRGAPLGVTTEVSHCVADVEQIDVDAGPSLYEDCNALRVGISPGWADVEAAFEPHVIELGTSPLRDGKYVLRAIADPDNLLWESPGKNDPARESALANDGLTGFEILNGTFVWEE
jgi:hypothetical protein